MHWTDKNIRRVTVNKCYQPITL